MDLIDEVTTGFGQPDAARVTVEQDNAKVLLQHLEAVLTVDWLVLSA